jgi:NADH-quinone oxidoreductase subunit G
LAAGRGLAFAWVPRRANARGALDAGLLPGLLPGGRTAADPGPLRTAWRRVPDEPGLDSRDMLEAAADGRLRLLYLIGVDPARDFEDPGLARAALERVPTVIAQDLLPTESTLFADVILPACAPQERVGSFTTWEGRRQPFPQAVAPQGEELADWDILRQLARAMGSELGWEIATDVRREAAPLMEVPLRATERLPAFAPPATLGRGRERGHEERVFDVVVLDYLLGDGTMLLGAKALKETARPASVWVSADDAAALGLHEGAAVAVVGPGGRSELPARVTTGVARGSVVLPGPSNGLALSALVERGAASTLLRVRLEPLAAGEAAGEIAPPEGAR